MTHISIIGSTGSIGCSTVDVVKTVNQIAPETYTVEAVVAGRNAALLAEQAQSVNARHAVLADETGFEELKMRLAGTGISCAAGQNAVLDAASRPVDKSMAAISGTAGLLPTMASIEAGSHILLANKETMVCAGPVVLAQAEKRGVNIIPVDSEHNALFQVYDRSVDIERMTLTASGGPFRTASLETMRDATPEAALAHPNWAMGAKNSLDSATMMNKGLELIEAAYLFGLGEDMIDVLVHPQSIVHAMVHYTDGSVLAHLSEPDMKTPIAHALAWPKRTESGVKRLELSLTMQLDFEKPDDVRFPALRLAREASRAGAIGTCVFNAANERAGIAYLNRQCGFLDIAILVQKVMDKALAAGNNEMPNDISTVDDVIAVTETAFRWVEENLSA